TILALSFLSFSALLPVACTKDFNFFEPSGAGGSATSSGSTSTTGGGGTGGCKSDAECDDKNPCTSDTCTAGKCSNTAIGDGAVPGFVDMVKDCQTEKCMGGKVVMGVADDTDVPDNSNTCVTESCMGGMPKETPVMSGMSCGTNLMCDGMGA